MFSLVSTRHLISVRSCVPVLLSDVHPDPAVHAACFRWGGSERARAVTPSPRYSRDVPSV